MNDKTTIRASLPTQQAGLPADHKARQAQTEPAKSRMIPLVLVAFSVLSFTVWMLRKG